MHFGMKITLKNNCNHTHKQAIKPCGKFLLDCSFSTCITCFLYKFCELKLKFFLFTYI